MINLFRHVDIMGQRLAFKIAWASDLHWDWTHSNGDVHHDIVALVLLRRPSVDVHSVRLTIGPLAIVAGIGPVPDEFAHLPPDERERAKRGEPYCNPNDGEWRCLCPPDTEFDTSINASLHAACAKCGAERPTPGSVAAGAP